jgi:hypothetical protein
MTPVNILKIKKGISIVSMVLLVLITTIGSQEKKKWLKTLFKNRKRYKF